MEGQKISEGGGKPVGGFGLDVPKLGEGSQEPESVDKSRTFATYGGKRRSLASIERLRKSDREKRKIGRTILELHEKELNYQRKWRDGRREKLRETYRKSYNSNIEKRRAKATAARAARTPEQITADMAHQKSYREKNKEAIRAGIKDWNAKNSDYRKEKSKEYLPRRLALNKKRRATDPIQRLKDACRTRVGFILRKAGIPKFNRTFELVGCTPDFFKAHIESQLEAWMNWDNYGTWEIDHIKPLAKFDLSVKEQLLAAFHYSNCQPLEKMENRIKNAKYSEPQTGFSKTKLKPSHPAP